MINSPTVGQENLIVLQQMRRVNISEQLVSDFHFMEKEKQVTATTVDRFPNNVSSAVT